MNQSGHPDQGANHEAHRTNILLEELRTEFQIFGESLLQLQADVQILKADNHGFKLEFILVKDQLKTIGPMVFALAKDMVIVKGDIKVLKNDVKVLKNDVAHLKTDVSALKADVSILKTDVSGLKADVADLKADVTDLKIETKAIHSDMSGFDRRLTVIERPNA